MKHWSHHDARSSMWAASGNPWRFCWMVIVRRHRSHLGDRWVLQPTLHYDRKTEAHNGTD